MNRFIIGAIVYTITGGSWFWTILALAAWDDPGIDESKARRIAAEEQKRIEEES